MSDLDNAINSINASAAKAENTATFLDDMSTFDDQSSVTNPNNGQTVASIPKQVKDRTDELFTAAESDINQAAADAEQSATDAQDAADQVAQDKLDIQDIIESFALKIFQSPTDGGLTEIQTRTMVGGEVYKVRKVSDDSLATIYSDTAGTTEIVQDGTSNVSGSDGVVEFYIADGDYYVEVGGARGHFKVSLLHNYIKNVDQERNIPSVAKNLIRTYGMYYRIANNKVYVGFTFGDSTPPKQYASAVEYAFAVDGDGLLLMSGVKGGAADLGAVKISEPTVSSGSITSSSAPNSYALLGTVLEGEFTGSALYFQSYRDDRGGDWLITLDSGHERRVSTYAATATSNVEEKLFDLPHGTYKYKMEMVGANPFNPPSTGVNGRGWLWYSPGATTQQPLRVYNVIPLDTSTQKNLVSAQTVLDFAITARPASASGVSSEWVPEHGATNGVAKGVNGKLIIDGDVIGGTTTLADKELTECTSIQIAQFFNATNPNDLNNPTMWGHHIVHSLDVESKSLTITNRLEFKTDTICTGYLSMFATDPRQMDRYLTSRGDEYDAFFEDNRYVNFKNPPKSIAFTGVDDASIGTNHIAAYSVNSIVDSCSVGRDFEPLNKYQENWRSNTLMKVYYNTVLDNQIIPSGTILHSESEVFCASGVRSPLGSFKPI